jgi:hypothetical protein
MKICIVSKFKTGTVIKLNRCSRGARFREYEPRIICFYSSLTKLGAGVKVGSWKLLHDGSGREVDTETRLHHPKLRDDVIKHHFSSFLFQHCSCDSDRMPGCQCCFTLFLRQKSCQRCLSSSRRRINTWAMAVGPTQRGGAQSHSRLGMPISAQTRENLARTVSLIFLSRFRMWRCSNRHAARQFPIYCFLFMPTLIVPFGILCQVKCQW